MNLFPTPSFKSILKTLLVFACLFFFSLTGHSQIVKFIKNPLQAKYRVFVTNKPAEASQWIYRVKGPTDIRKPGHWYIVTNPQLFSKSMLLYKVDTSKDADIVVYYVSTSDSAMIRNVQID